MPELPIAHLTGRRVRLRELVPNDYNYLYHLAVAEETSYRWRYRGITPSPEEFGRNLWQNVTAQFIVERTSDQQRIGHVVAFDANHRDRWVHVAAVGEHALERSGLVMEAVGLLVDYVFIHWDFQKIYFSAIEFNYSSFASGAGRLFSVEGRLRDHCFYGDRYWDMILGAVFRTEWNGSWREMARESLNKVDDDGVALAGYDKSGELLGLEYFIECFVREFPKVPGPQPSDSLADDLQFDSLDFIVAFEWLGELASLRELPGELMDPLPVTLRDLFLIYYAALQWPTLEEEPGSSAEI